MKYGALLFFSPLNQSKIQWSLHLPLVDFYYKWWFSVAFCIFTNEVYIFHGELAWGHRCQVDAKTLAEGKHYRVCLEMDETAPMGYLAQTLVIQQFLWWFVKQHISGWWWLEPWNFMTYHSVGKCWEFHPPNWRTHIFQRGRYTTNQISNDVYNCIYIYLQSHEY